MGSSKLKITPTKVNIKNTIAIKIDGLNISLDASDVTQMNNTSIPPKKIKNKM